MSAIALVVHDVLDPADIAGALQDVRALGKSSCEPEPQVSHQSIGGGTNKLVAKLAVERAKPKPGTGADGVHIVEPGTEEDFLRTFTLAELPLVGPKFQERLAKLGMTTVPDVLQHGPQTLQRWLGEREGGWLSDRVHGVSDSEVESGSDQKSISRDETFAVDLHDHNDLEHELVALVTRAAFDLRSDRLAARTITVRIRDKDFRTRSVQRTLAEPVVSDRVILRVAGELPAKLRAACAGAAARRCIIFTGAGPQSRSAQAVPGTRRTFRGNRARSRAGPHGRSREG